MKLYRLLMSLSRFKLIYFVKAVMETYIFPVQNDVDGDEWV